MQAVSVFTMESTLKELLQRLIVFSRRTITVVTSSTSRVKNLPMERVNVIFVVGTGRSGTHFTCRCLREFSRLDDFQGGREHAPTLYSIAHAAMKHERLPTTVRPHYRKRRLQALLKRQVLVDQHHPNLFFVTEWLRRTPGAVFLYPERPAVQIVASMLTHEGVGGWYEKLRTGKLMVPYPNRFFGLNSLAQLQTEPLHRICWHRVRAHKEAALRARARHGDRVRFVDYQALVRDRVAALSAVFSPEEMARFGHHQLATPSTDYSLEKYRDVLDADQIAEIETLEADWLALRKRPASHDLG